MRRSNEVLLEIARREIIGVVKREAQSADEASVLAILGAATLMGFAGPEIELEPSALFDYVRNIALDVRAWDRP